MRPWAMRQMGTVLAVALISFATNENRPHLSHRPHLSQNHPICRNLVPQHLRPEKKELQAMLKEEKETRMQKDGAKPVEDIIASTWEYLYRYIYYKVQNREEAEDITQETYAKALSHLQKSSVGSDGIRADNCMGFLKTVSMNILRDRWRKRKRQGPHVGFDAVNPDETAVDDLTEAAAQRALIESAMNRLTEEQRTVIMLRIIKGYTAAETARIMGKKESTIRVIQYRGLQALAAILGKND